MTEPAEITLAALDALPDQAFAALLGPVFEDTPAIARAAAAKRPFASVSALHQAMMEVVRGQGPDEILDFLRRHPPLAPPVPERPVTGASAAEQKAAGLAVLDQDAAARLAGLNREYEAHFGFPFIMAVRHQNIEAILAALSRRLTAIRAAEIGTALDEIGLISWFRLLDRVMPAATGSISLHAIEISAGRAAEGLPVTLWRDAAEGPVCVARFVTNGNGDSDTPIVARGELRCGTYEFRADAATYFARTGGGCPIRPFFGVIQIAFFVQNPEETYHLPLHLTPGSYTAYRGN